MAYSQYQCLELVWRIWKPLLTHFPIFTYADIRVRGIRFKMNVYTCKYNSNDTINVLILSFEKRVCCIQMDVSDSGANGVPYSLLFSSNIKELQTAPLLGERFVFWPPLVPSPPLSFWYQSRAAFVKNKFLKSTFSCDKLFGDSFRNVCVQYLWACLR